MLAASCRSVCCIQESYIYVIYFQREQRLFAHASIKCVNHIFYKAITTGMSSLYVHARELLNIVLYWSNWIIILHAFFFFFQVGDCPALTSLVCSNQITGESILQLNEFHLQRLIRLCPDAQNVKRCIFQYLHNKTNQVL